LSDHAGQVREIRRRAMARTVYYVVLHHGIWMVKLGDIHTGPYKNQKDAIRAAKAAGDQSAYLRVQGPDNKFQSGWTCGRDPLPTISQAARRRPAAHGLNV
jgi:hypothetical protein